MKLKGILALSCAAILFGAIAHADDNTIVVTATRTQAKILQTPSKVDVITQKQMKDKGTLYVKDALKYVPGITITSNGSFGGTTSVYMRGLSNRYIKTLIDGIDVSDPSLMQPYYDFANLLPDDINRIEIVQGAQSGLYGANAVGGVINILTKTGKGKPYIKYTQEYGSYKTLKENLESGGQINDFSFYGNLVQFDTNGISKTDKLNSDGSYSRGDEKDSYHQTGFSSRLEYKPNESIKIGTVFKWYKTRNYLDYYGWSNPNDNSPSNTTPTARSYRGETHFFISKLYIKKEFKSLSVEPSIFYVQNLRYNRSIDPSWGYNKYFKGRRWGSNLTATYKINRTTLTFGASQKIDKYESSTPLKKLRYNDAIFGEIQQGIGNLNLQVTAREDWFKTFGKHFTYKFGANYLIPQTNTVLKANYGTGFRAPSFYELFSQFGNPNLKPEEAKSWDFGSTQLLSLNSSITLMYFKNIIKNRIGWGGHSYDQVKGKTISDGVEIGAKTKPAEFLTIGANYTYTASKDPDSHMQAARIPLRVYTGYITVNALNNKLTSTLDGRYIGKRYDDSSHTHQTGKYAVFDFTLIYKPIKNLEASLTVKNIFNRFYEEVYGYSTLPRSAFASLSYKF